MENVETKCIEIANDYVEKELEAATTEYQITFQGTEDDSDLCVVHAMHQDDLDPDRPVYPGAGSGKSLKLVIDPAAGKVTQALGFQ